MSLPTLPHDLLADVIFTIVPSAGCTTLLASKFIRALALPLFWRALVVARPSDFVSFFDPQTVLSISNGQLREQR